MEPRSGIIFQPATRPPQRFRSCISAFTDQSLSKQGLPTYNVCPNLLCMSPPIMSVPSYHVCPHLLCLSPPSMSVPTYHVCPLLLCLSQSIMSVPTYYVCPHLSCLSPPIMSVPMYHVCPLLICLSPPIMSVPTDYFVLVCPQPSFLCWQALFKSWVWHFQLGLFF